MVVIQFSKKIIEAGVPTHTEHLEYGHMLDMEFYS